MADKNITCKMCGQEFTFTVGEQEWYSERNLNEPKYCKACRAERRKQKEKQNNIHNDSVKKAA